MAKRRPKKARGLGAVKVPPADSERLVEMRDNSSHRRLAREVTRAACKVVRDGNGFGRRKAFIADVAKTMNARTVEPAFARLLVAYNQLGWITLARADLAGRMDPTKVDASEIEVGTHGARFHFVECDDD